VAKWVVLDCRAKKFFENASKSSDDENMMLHAVLKKSRSHVKSRIEIATLREDTDPDIGVHGEARM